MITNIAVNEFIAFVNASTEAGVTGKPYMKAIKELEEFINERVFNTYSLDQLRVLKKRLSKDGDLHDFNMDRGYTGDVSAAIGKLIPLRIEKA